jgi:hypothetical protein
MFRFNHYILENLKIYMALYQTLFIGKENIGYLFVE